MSFISNTTPTPNWLYNGEMRKMSDTELRVVLLVTRATLGWIIDKQTGMRKIEDWISHTELIKRSGRSSPVISSAINNCVKQGWIETRDGQGNLLLTSEERKRRRIYYRLGDVFTNKLSTKESKVDNLDKKNLPNLIVKSTKESKVDLPKKLRNTKERKETIQKKDTETSSDCSSKQKKERQETTYNIIQDFKQQVKKDYGFIPETDKSDFVRIYTLSARYTEKELREIMDYYFDSEKYDSQKFAKRPRVAFSADTINKFKQE